MELIANLLALVGQTPRNARCFVRMSHWPLTCGCSSSPSQPSSLGLQGQARAQDPALRVRTGRMRRLIVCPRTQMDRRVSRTSSLTTTCLLESQLVTSLGGGQLIFTCMNTVETLVQAPSADGLYLWSLEDHDDLLRAQDSLGQRTVPR